MKQLKFLSNKKFLVCIGFVFAIFILVLISIFLMVYSWKNNPTSNNLKRIAKYKFAQKILWGSTYNHDMANYYSIHCHKLKDDKDKVEVLSNLRYSGNYNILLCRGYANLNLKQWGTAIEDFELALQYIDNDNSSRSMLYREIGRAYIQKGNFYKAKENFIKAFDIDEKIDIEYDKTHVDCSFRTREDIKELVNLSILEANKTYQFQTQSKLPLPKSYYEKQRKDEIFRTFDYFYSKHINKLEETGASPACVKQSYENMNNDYSNYIVE